MMNLTEEIERLHQLHQTGALTDDEYAQAKAKLLAAPEAGGFAPGQPCALAGVNRLRRSRQDRIIGGVCGGLGKVTGLESWVWRLLFVLFTVCFGFGLVIYILSWLLIPEEV